MIKRFLDGLDLQLLAWLSQLINLGIHIWLFILFIDPQGFIKRSVEQLGPELQQTIEQSLAAEGLFEFMINMPELPSSVIWACRFGLVMTVVSWAVTAKAFVDLLQLKKWAVNYVWSIVVLTGLLGVIGPDFYGLAYAFFAGSILWRYRNGEPKVNSLAD